MKRELSDAEKEVFRAAAERRNKVGIKRGRILITQLESKQVEDFYTVYDYLVEQHGKRETVNWLIYAMSRACAKTKDGTRD